MADKRGWGRETPAEGNSLQRVSLPRASAALVARPQAGGDPAGCAGKFGQFTRSKQEQGDNEDKQHLRGTDGGSEECQWHYNNH